MHYLPSSAIIGIYKHTNTNVVKNLRIYHVPRIQLRIHLKFPCTNEERLP